ncbi:MAG TPA: hypothetical protein PLD25_24330 [Chloroflexota bacterium]|nr:hypothetical protein [Chloroflexota bacterium]
MLHTRSRRLFIALIMALVLSVFFMLLGRGPGTAAGAGLPPRPTTSPTPTIPTATPAPTAVPPTNGAAIRLHTSKPYSGAWTVVQWQNEHGNWYDVEGWRGHLDEGNATMKTWWVYPTNYGQGPFRWLVYANQNGKQLAVSDSFALPTRNGQTISVEVELP